jgi:hypothetical protein
MPINQVPTRTIYNRPNSPAMVNYIVMDNPSQITNTFPNPRITMNNDSTPTNKNNMNRPKPSFLNKNPYSYPSTNENDVNYTNSN